MPGVDFDKLRKEIRMVEVLDRLGFCPATRSGDQWHGPCPIHRSQSKRSRSLSVNVRQDRYFCHKCHSKGNVIEFWAAVQNLTEYQAAIDLCRVLGRPIPWIYRW